MKPMRSMALLALAALASGPAAADEGKDESGKGYREHHVAPREGSGQQGSYFHEHGYTQVDIPKGHYPPPGECRLWYPERPAGQQPPPFKCGDAVPPGAWLIHHPRELQDRVHVTVYEPQRPGVVRAVGEFRIGSGTLVRVVLDR